MAQHNLQDYLYLAEAAARAAGARLAARAPDWQGVTSEKGKDVKAKADILAEALITGLLQKGSTFPILGEEGGWQGQQSGDEFAWIVDPLDGTANYTKEIPLCAVSIALVKGAEPVLGVIYDFNSDELYSGLVGVGAWLNHVPMKTSDVCEPEKSILMTGLPARRDFSAESLGSMAEDMAAWRKVRMIGSAALAVAYVACGRAECYKEESVMFWDVAAGCALVMAAGGRVQMSAGALDAPKSVRADNGALKLPDS